jgi:hypothetical protein
LIATKHLLQKVILVCNDISLSPVLLLLRSLDECILDIIVANYGAAVGLYMVIFLNVANYIPADTE